MAGSPAPAERKLPIAGAGLDRTAPATAMAPAPYVSNRVTVPR